MAATNSKKEETLKDPPKNLEAERNLLGALMRDGTLLAAIGNEIGPLNPDDFASEKNRIIYSCILNRAASSDEFDPTVICSILENEGLLDKVGGKAYISGLIANTAPESVAIEYALIIRNNARRRRLISAAEKISNMGYMPEGRTVDELYDEAQGLIFKLSEENAHTDAGPVPALTHAVKLLEKIQHDKDLGQRMTGIPSGFSELDELTSGLQPGSLNIVAARPGVGKTSFSMNIVENIAMNPDIHKPALVFSLEMPAQQIVLRMLSTFGRVSMRELSEGKVTTNQWHDIIRKVAMLTETDENNVKRNKLYIDDSGDVTPLEVRSRARKLAAEHGGLSVIMIDYIQLMKGQTKAENRSLEVGEISRSLKLLAKDLEVPVIALSQLNREVENRKDHRPMNSDLRESGSLEQDADMIMFLHREATYHGGGDGEDNGKALLIVSKNRNGAIKDIELQFQGAYTAFYDKANTVAMMDVPPIDDVLLQ